MPENFRTEAPRVEFDIAGNPTSMIFGSGYPEYINAQPKIPGERFAILENPSEIAVQHFAALWEEQAVQLTEPLVRRLYGEHIVGLLRDGIEMPIHVLNPEDLVAGTLDSRIEHHVFQSMLKRPVGVLQVSGGAAGLLLPKFDLGQEVFQLQQLGNAYGRDAIGIASTVYQIASERNLAIVDGGTNSGIMAAISMIHLNHRIAAALAQKHIQQFLPDKMDSSASDLLTTPLLVQAVPGACVLIPGYNDPGKYEWEKYPVSPADITFVMRGKTFGGELGGFVGSSGALGYVGAMERVTRSILTGIGNDRSSNRRIVLTINGGGLTLDEVRAVMTKSLDSAQYDPESGSSVVLFSGSGRAANHLSTLLEHPTMTVGELADSTSGNKDLTLDDYKAKLAITADLLRAHNARGKVRTVYVDDPRIPVEDAIKGAVASLAKSF